MHADKPIFRHILLVSLALAGAAPVTAVASAPLMGQDAKSNDAARMQDDEDKTKKKAEDIASQPARDIGAKEIKVPPLLAAAAEAPYTMTGVGTCTALAGAIADLNRELGPDFSEEPAKESKKGKLAEAGGRAVVNSIIPFRGIVREVSGAAAADRRLQAAIDAGYARRGFLRGVHRARGCKTAI
ncbi:MULTISPECIES: hypothetical protein [unclassified Sphingomonas]|jgi:hypothetical protein|nr:MULTISPECIES: hypothetical protein [unclassified Sphingomonas]